MEFQQHSLMAQKASIIKDEDAMKANGKDGIGKGIEPDAGRYTDELKESVLTWIIQEKASGQDKAVLEAHGATSGLLLHASIATGICDKENA